MTRGVALEAPSEDAVVSGQVAASPQAGEETPAKEGSSNFPIVGIGASAGSLAAYEAFFSSMPRDYDTGMAFVVVQHLSPDHKSMMSGLIQRYTKMEVQQVEDGTEVRPNRVYIIPPNRDLVLEGRMLRLYEPSEPRAERLPIDSFFRSLAKEQRERAICVVLSGTGSDGTLGARAVKGEGGMLMVQDPDTTEHDGMPRSAIATGLVDYVLAPSDMPAQLVAYVRHAFDGSHATASEPIGDGMLKQLAELLQSHTGHDFSQYKVTTLMRRMNRRMALRQIDRPADYFRFAEENPAEIDALFRDLLIGVTSFFRDPEAFRVLEEKVVPRLFHNRSPQDSIRVWVAGCSTGEEAYSIAILMQERMEALRRLQKIQIFATDIDRHAIEQARAGIFPRSIAADLTPDRLNRFFTLETDRNCYRVQKGIRDLVVFSEQDIIKDPPFSKLDLITCRNLLIYVKTDLQRKLIPLFHYALNPGGWLFLGTSETVGEFTRLFAPLDRKWRIYHREPREPGAGRPPIGEFVPGLNESLEVRRAGRPPGDPALNLRYLTEQTLLTHYAEAAVLVNGRGDIQHIYGRTGKYLEPASGDAALNVIPMARDGLRRELTSALHKIVARRQPLHYRGLRIKANGGYISANLTLRPVTTSVETGPTDLFLVVLEEAPAPAEESSTERTQQDPTGRVAELEHELRAKEEYLQTTLEEMETTNEELKSTNEEMQSVNEELQSANEELETSKEELQSVNEELSTVNAELQDKVAELSRANNDMNNLLAGTGIGTVFVDHQARILRFTPAATQVINLIATDLGRPVGHVMSNLADHGDLTEDIQRVLETLIPKEAEVRTRSGAWYLMRIRPYRTIENVIEGAVLTFVDVSDQKRAVEALEDRENRFRAIFDRAFAAMAETDPSGRFAFLSERFTGWLGYSREELLQMRLETIVHLDDRHRHRAAFDSLVAGGPEYMLELRYRRKDGSSLWVAERVSALTNASGEASSLIVVATDLSERKRLEAEAGETNGRLSADLESLSRLSGIGTLRIGEGTEQAVLDEILDAALAAAGTDLGILELCIPPTRDLTIVAQRGFNPPFLDYWGSDGNRLAAAALEGGQPITVTDAARDPYFEKPPGPEFSRSAGFEAIHVAPVVTRTGKRLGAISAHFRPSPGPDPRSFRFLDLLARLAAEILCRASLGDVVRKTRR